MKPEWPLEEAELAICNLKLDRRCHTVAKNDITYAPSRYSATGHNLLRAPRDRNPLTLTMDPLTALSLAGTVVQFVDFGCKLLSEGRQLYKSTSGKLKSNEEIEIITLDLQTLVKKLRGSLSYSDLGVSTKQQVEERKSLQLICDRASTIAEEMIRELNKIILPNSAISSNASRRTVKTVKQLLKARLNSHDIADLVARLTELRKAIDTNLLFSTK